VTRPATLPERDFECEDVMSFDQVRADWTRLGAEDPLWAVLVDPDKRGGRWDADEFLAVGSRDVVAHRQWLARLGLPTTWRTALDFGCGAGRLTQALAAHADEVIGVDVSAPMLATARSLDGTGRCRFLLSEHPDLREVPGDSVDLLVTERVLQHLPPEVLDGYLREFVRVLRPGGVALLHAPTTPLWTARGVVWRLVPGRLVRLAQQRLLGYPAPMRMTGLSPRRLRRVIEGAGAEVLAGADVDEPETHWHARRWVIRKDAPAV
jgi:SAM-dependent methyltransferase